MGTKFKPPFRVGDVVVDRSDSSKTQVVIHEVTYQDNLGFEYMTSTGGWFSHKALKLIRECDAESLQRFYDEAESE